MKCKLSGGVNFLPKIWDSLTSPVNCSAKVQTDPNESCHEKLRKLGIENVEMCRWMFALLLHINVYPSIWLFFLSLKCQCVSFNCIFFSNTFPQLCTGKIRIEMAAAVVSSWEMITQKVSAAREISCRNLWTNMLHEPYFHFQER